MKEFTCCFPLASRCSATSRRVGLITRNGFLRRQTPSLQTAIPFSFTPAVIAECDATWHGTPLWSVWWCSLPAPGALAACLLQGSRRSRKGLGSMHVWLKTSVCYQHFYKKIQNIASYEPPGKKKMTLV